jgi:hypothetical protein
MGFSDYLMVSIVAKLKMDYRCVTLMQKVGLCTTQKLEKIELQLGLSDKFFTESVALFLDLQKNHAEDKGQPSPAIRTPRRSGWAGGRGKYLRQRGSESPRWQAPVKRRPLCRHRNPPRDMLASAIKGSTILIPRRPAAYKLSAGAASPPHSAQQRLNT